MMSTTRRSFLGLLRRCAHVAAGLAIGSGSGALFLRHARAEEDEASPESGPDFQPLRKNKAEWRRLLSADRYAVLFEEDTEPPWSSDLNKESRTGTFVCAACFLPLFDSKTKFDSGTGWPSFWQALEGHVGTRKDFRLIIPRTEYHCARCGGHQGHVFEDGPPPTGQRWCNNGLALRFVPEAEPLPRLRT